MRFEFNNIIFVEPRASFTVIIVLSKINIFNKTYEF